MWAGRGRRLVANGQAEQAPRVTIRTPGPARSEVSGTAREWGADMKFIGAHIFVRAVLAGPALTDAYTQTLAVGGPTP
jgi:hypothetical protein